MYALPCKRNEGFENALPADERSTNAIAIGSSKADRSESTEGLCKALRETKDHT
jgi:hypothetical protein